MKKVESKVSGKQGDKKNLQYLTLVTKRDAIGALRNLSTHDDCDEDIVKHGGIEFFITSMAEIINKYLCFSSNVFVRLITLIKNVKLNNKKYGRKSNI